MKKILIFMFLFFFYNSSIAAEKHGIRLGLFGGSGTFSLKINDALNGKYDHDLKGGSWGISYNRTNDNNLYYGGGYQSVVKYSDDWKKSTDEVSGYWTYYNSTYGYFDADITVDEFRSNFFYGLVGYEVKISEDCLFQPNVKIGQKTVIARWRTFIDWRSYADQNNT